MSYQVVMTISSFEIVKMIPEDSYGLVLGINAFFGVGFQTILTIIVNTWLGIEPAPQFVIYACFYLVITLIFLPLLILDLLNYLKGFNNLSQS